MPSSFVRAVHATMLATVVTLLLACAMVRADDVQASRAAASVAATSATPSGLTVAAAADNIKPAVTVATSCKCYGCSETEGYLGPQPLNNLLFQDLKAAKWEQDATKHCPCCGPRASLYLNVTDGQSCASVGVLAPFRAAVMEQCGQTSAVLKRAGLTLKGESSAAVVQTVPASDCLHPVQRAGAVHGVVLLMSSACSRGEYVCVMQLLPHMVHGCQGGAGGGTGLGSRHTAAARWTAAGAVGGCRKCMLATVWEGGWRRMRQPLCVQDAACRGGEE